jgi:transposase
MIKKQEIIIGYFRQGKSKKQLARDLEVSRNTVKKYISAHKEKQSVEYDLTKIPPEGVLEAPIYDAKNRSRKKLTTAVCKQIDVYLSDNRRKQGIGRSKQQMKGVDIYEALLDAGYKIGYRTVCRYIRQGVLKNREVFIRQDYDPGQAVEFDWGYVKIDIDGKSKQMMLAVFSCTYSSHRWARLYYRQDMAAFLDAHSCYFTATGAVPQQIIYDNMRTVVKKFTIRNADKLPTDDLLKLCTYYTFDYRFCNAGKGNEKGKVERSVEYVRRKAFCRLDSFDTLADANTHLSTICNQLAQRSAHGHTQSIQSRFDEALGYMKVIPLSPYDTADLRSLRVDKYSCVQIDRNYYSVLEGHVGQLLDVKVYPNSIEVYDDKNKCIAIHERQHSRFQYFLHLDHYLKTLRTKPGALMGALSFKQADERLRALFEQYFTLQSKVFIDLLLWCRSQNYSIEEMQKATHQCHRYCPHQLVDLDKIKVLLQRNSSTQIQTTSMGTSDMSRDIYAHCTQQLEAINALI